MSQRADLHGESDLAGTRWFYAQNGNRIGPLPWEELQRLALTGLIAATDMVVREGTARWQQAGALPALGLAGALTEINNAPSLDATGPYTPRTAKPVEPHGKTLTGDDVPGADDLS